MVEIATTTDDVMIRDEAKAKAKPIDSDHYIFDNVIWPEATCGRFIIYGIVREDGNEEQLVAGLKLAEHLLEK